MDSFLAFTPDETCHALADPSAFFPAASFSAKAHPERTIKSTGLGCRRA
jgi:hypothetical protein